MFTKAHLLQLQLIYLLQVKLQDLLCLIRFLKTTFVSFVDADGYWQIIQVFDWKSLLIVISILTMTLGNFSALWQNNLKRMLAYSSIAHAGYLLLGLVVFSNTGMMAILIYFAVYLMMNLGAFLVVMLIANKTGSEEIDDYNGLGLTSPFLGITLAIFPRIINRFTAYRRIYRKTLFLCCFG